MNLFAFTPSLLLILFVVSVTIGGFLIAPPVGFFCFGGGCLVSAYLLGSD